MNPTILVPRQRQGTVRQEGTNVQIILEGRLLMDLTWQSALELAKAIHATAKKAEELANAEKIIFDQAILDRLGAPVSLVTRKDMAVAAKKEAAWNTPLRRYIRRSRLRQGIVYAPSVTQDRPEDT